MLRRLIIVLSLIVLVGSGVVVSSVYIAATRWRSVAVQEIEIKPGMSVRRIARQLTLTGVIRTPKLFEIYARVKGVSGGLRAGTYEFPAGMTMPAVLDKIAKGDVKTYLFTVVEGWTVKDIAQRLENQPFLEGRNVPGDFLGIVRDGDYIKSLGLEGVSSLEGYLFPDTYLLGRPTSADELIRRMVGRFKGVWGAVSGSAPDGMGTDQHKIVTLASMVEKETGLASERPLIAAVFLNRLKKGIPLQSDPTVIYGLPNFDGNIRKRDLSDPHPYNTYVRAGLPPGPICNPGKASLEAVLHPTKVDYLYFVSRNDGSHFFSERLADHMMAVRKYQVEGGGRK